MPEKIMKIEDIILTLKQGKESTYLVKNVSLSLNKNSVTGLIGESGCGKSMTCLSIMGMLPDGIEMTKGKIEILGKNVSEMKPSERRSFCGKDIAMILQNPMSCFDSVFKIRHHFMETIMSHGRKDKKKIVEDSKKALVEVGFDNPAEILDLYPFQMSGGMLQRIMVALAIIMNVSILIADEPTTDLDLVSQVRILDLLERLKKDFGISILLVTHDLSVIARLADEIVVMKDGKVVETGNSRKIFTTSEEPYTKSLLDAHFRMYGEKLRKLDSGSKVYTVYKKEVGHEYIRA